MHRPRKKGSGDEAVTFRRPRTQMDEPGHRFSGVKQPPGCRETGAPRKPPIVPQSQSRPIRTGHPRRQACIVDASGRHRHACRVVLGYRTKAGPPLSRREAVLWLPMSMLVTLEEEPTAGSNLIRRRVRAGADASTSFKPSPQRQGKSSREADGVKSTVYSCQV